MNTIQSQTDTLTGLPGRSILVERLISLPSTATIALLCIDLDRLASINESMGVAAGNQVLIAAAERIAAHVGPSTLVVRHGGDEFAVLLDPAHSVDQVRHIARSLYETLMQPYEVEGQKVFVGASMGLACTLVQSAPPHLPQATTPEQILRHARAALERAKIVARGSWLLYEPSMGPGASERLRLETELALALQREQMQVGYQPRVACRSGALIGFEVRMHWQHPIRGLLPASEFMQVLEETGLINQAGRWLLRSACQQLAAWDQMGHAHVGMAVDVCLQQLMDPLYLESLQATLTEYGIPPHRLELELNANLLMQDMRQIEALLLRLKQLGVRLSVHDAGIGYSSLAHIKRLPIDTVKIDSSFVRNVTASAEDASITRALVGMAHSLNLQVVAVGVQTKAQLPKLAAKGCDAVQGPSIGQSLAADQAQGLLTSGWNITEEFAQNPAAPPTLLLVDDEESILSSLKRLLRREGYRILSATSGTEGLELLACNNVDVIISDQRMPHMTGVEFLRLAKEMRPDTVRMVLSGYADMQSIASAINQGAIYKFMSKPWDDQDLKDSVAEAFRRKELSDENGRLTREIAEVNEDLNRLNKALALLLDEQSRTAQLGQAALSASQQTLHLLPMPVLGLDPDGTPVLRNEAFAQLKMEDEAVHHLMQVLPAWPATEVVCAMHLDDAGRQWRVTGRNLWNAGQHSGAVFVFVPASAP